MKHAKWLGVAAAGLLMAGGCCTVCEEPMALTDLPPAALRTIEQHAGGGTIQSVEMKERDMKLYKAKVKQADGSELKILVSEDGKLYKLEREESKHD
jgi:hypothetical protein